jgi:hypothetical protein
VERQHILLVLLAIGHGDGSETAQQFMIMQTF